MYHFLEIILPYLVAFYLLSCVVYIRPFNLVFFNIVGRTYGIKTRGLSFIPLLPTSRLYTCHRPPLFLTSRGILIPGKARSDDDWRFRAEKYTCIPFDKIASLERDETRIRVNKNPPLYLGGVENALSTISIIGELKTLNSQERSRRLREYSFSRARLDEMMRTKNVIEDNTHLTGIFSTLLSLGIFGGIPVFVYSDLRNQINPLALVVPLLLLYCATVGVALAIYRNIPGSEVKKRGITVMLAILSPMGALHLVRDLCREAMSQFDYLVLAAVMAPPEVFHYYARLEYIRIEEALDDRDLHEYKEALNLREEVVDTILKQKNLTQEDIFKTPGKNDTSATQYCPLCLTEYLKEAEKCTACSLTLKPYSKT